MYKLTRILAATTLLASIIAFQGNPVEARCSGRNKAYVTTFDRDVYMEVPAPGTCDFNKHYSFNLRLVAVGCVSVFFQPVKGRIEPVEFKNCSSMDATFNLVDDDYGSNEWFTSVRGTSGKVWNTGY